jgi:heme-degrading monooxygenase HmoA
MILEVADIRIPPGQNAAFEKAVGDGLANVMARAKGFIAHKVQKGIESPERYLLMIWWHTLENHTVDFRQGPLFPEWRAYIGPYLAVPPNVEHFNLALESGWPRG